MGKSTGDAESNDVARVGTTMEPENMPTVYRVLPDPDEFQSVLADDVKSVMQYRFDGSTIGEAWQPPVVYSPFPTKQEGDFWSCLSCTFAVSKDAAPSIVKFLDQSCEVLPLPLGDRTLLLCNVTFVLNCLDEIKSRHKPGLPHWMEEYVFHPHRFEYSLFKIPQTSMSEVLCAEGLVDGDDGFKATVEKLGLKGLRFQELWSDE